MIVNVISSDSTCKNGNVRFTSVPLKLLSDQYCGRYCRFSGFRSIKLCSYIFLGRKTTIENKQFSKLSTLIFNTHLIRQNFRGYFCESGIAIFAWRVSYYFAYSPFKIIPLGATELEPYKWTYWDNPILESEIVYSQQSS